MATVIQIKRSSATRSFEFLQEKIFSIEFYQSIAVFNIDCNYSSTGEKIYNEGISDNAEDLRFNNDKKFLDKYGKKYSWFN